MREEIEKAIFDLSMNSDRMLDAFTLRIMRDDIMKLVDKYVEDEIDRAYEDGCDAGREENYFEIEDAREEGYNEGYSDGYDARSEELSD